MDIFQKAWFGWVIRRLMDWGGWIGTFATFLMGVYSLLGPRGQELVNQALSGNWQSITLGSLVPVIILVVSQVFSFKATTKDQMVQDGTKVETPPEEKPATKAVVEKAVVEKKYKSPLERIFTWG